MSFLSNRTNADIVPLAMRGVSAATKTHNMSTDHFPVGTKRTWAPYIGYLSKRLSIILHQRFQAGTIRQVIYSYSTPIAWLDGETWVVPDVSYSPTTSTKHQSQLWRLRDSVSIPGDCGVEEYQRVLDGLMTYTRGYGNKLGTYAPGKAEYSWALSSLHL